MWKFKVSVSNKGMIGPEQVGENVLQSRLVEVNRPLKE
jgi:hypothetical protein